MLATFGDAGDNPLGNAAFQLAGGEIVEEEKRFAHLARSDR
jgi:hypothetical protein